MSDTLDYVIVVADDTDPALKDALSKLEYFVYDATRVVVEAPLLSKFTIGKTEVVNVTSKVWYLDANDEKKKMYLIFPDQQTFGVHYKLPFGKDGDAAKDESKDDAKDKKTKVDPAKAIGFQMDFPLQALGQVNPKTKELTPSEHEKKVMNMIDSLRSLTIATGRKEIDEHEQEESILPGPAYNAFFAANGAFAKKGIVAFSNAVKPGYEWPRVKDAKLPTFDKSKPARMYFDLVSTGKETKLVCKTTFYNLDEEEDEGRVATAYLDQSGVCRPVAWFKHVFWGAHGQKPYGASMKFVIVQAFFRPGGGSSSAVTTRLIPAKKTGTSSGGAAAAASASKSKSKTPPGGSDDDKDVFDNSDDDEPTAALAAAAAAPPPKEKKSTKSKNSKKHKKSKKASKSSTSDDDD